MSVSVSVCVCVCVVEGCQERPYKRPELREEDLGEGKEEFVVLQKPKEQSLSKRKKSNAIE